ncbi:polyisoprenoid-binding protein YceI [Catalinimonas alkaloidigena]|uniref:YceI family protein n=1 Tax=Catalinimonas alkaloidigena TaxID=1075417 RepID=UPI002406B909|nr:YceI family protein [Catalinimonas alkaloidigena]MDF9798560.1 polyisoprenoid-binding protein YceI [Catalinimonas alkaloidigena]
MENVAEKKASWAVDPMHSEIQFKVKHLVISTVTGSFGKYDASFSSEKEDFSDAQISFSADVNSISTNNEQRDAHLKSDDFFNAEQYPNLAFTSKTLKKTADDAYKLVGDLTIRDITKTVELDVEYGGTMVDPYGNTKVGFEVSGKINRKEFGLKWDAITEAGGAVVSDQVKIIANVQFARQA